MRSDMSKVITERPRHGLRLKQPKGYKKEFAQTDWEDMPNREKIRLKWRKNWNDGKEFSERLGPLTRWLFSKVGQNYNDVHSELCEHLSRDSVIQDHVRDHAEQMVEKGVEIINGVPCYGEKQRFAMLRGIPITDHFYVHPDTNRLEYAPAKKTKREKKQKFVKVDDTHQMHKIKGIWYMIEVKPYDPKDFTVRKEITYGNKTFYRDVFVPYYDGLMNRMVTQAYQAKEFYGGYFMATGKRQLNSKEIKDYGLRDL